MRRADKAERIGEILDELYPDPPVPLDHTDPYTLLVAVALSAQTTDKKVNEVTPSLFAAAGTPEEMAALSPDEPLESGDPATTVPGLRDLVGFSVAELDDETRALFGTSDPYVPAHPTPIRPGCTSPDKAVLVHPKHWQHAASSRPFRLRQA